MSHSPELMKQFEEKFKQIRDGEEAPRPDLFGYSRVARQLHKVETAVTWLRRDTTKNYGIPLPTEPVTAYELWQKAVDDADLGLLFSDIFNANPNAFVSGSGFG